MQDSLNDLKDEYGASEEKFIGKMKEGIVVAASHLVWVSFPSGVCFYIPFGPWGFLYYKTLRLFYNEETLLARADAKVKELQQSNALLKAEGEKLEIILLFPFLTFKNNGILAPAFHVKRRALQVEDEIKRGRTKLKQAGNQIQSAICSAYKIENQASSAYVMVLSGFYRLGLKDTLGELPGREASVSNLASEAKRERNLLTKEVNRISNYGLSDSKHAEHAGVDPQAYTNRGVTNNDINANTVQPENRTP
ncbi:hypothetical protein RJ641_016231 [Dillenia turbinata]|uniref:Uncharacterized protein n=1 Tax=Dillenia turbinata TaxID=194707 RepID=A0AAN8Z0Z1_9MAGN